MRFLRGFTLIELLVVIAIVSLLSAVVLASLNSARAKARDAERRSDLYQVRLALEQYYDVHHTYRVSGSGASGNGNGYAAYENGGSYPIAVTRGLYNEGYLPTPVIEDPIQHPGYMLYLCNGDQQFALSATLENPTANDITYIQTTCNGTGSNGTYTRYGKNFAVGN